MRIIHYLLVSLIILNVSNLKAQTATENPLESMRIQLQNWDPIRGEWLANSLISFSKNQPIPDRTFPEEFTPYQLLTLVPMESRKEILNSFGRSSKATNSTNSNELTQVEMIFNHTFCELLTGRSYGDPHLVSFDRASYSFQTVGEFVLSKSLRGHFEVQTRQKPQSDNFSLNTAIAMNVAGDRLCYYAEDKPDFDNTPFRLEGQPLRLQGRTYFLPHGGTIRLEGRNYIVCWPSGESVIMDSRMSGNMQLANITVQVFACDQGQFEGLLGNANGNMNDDFNSRSNSTFRPAYASFSTFGHPSLAQGSQIAEKEYLAFLAKDFAEDWRVNDLTTLFDYAIGRSTYTYTDRSFPRVHYTLNDLDMNRQTNARRRCEQMGISQEEMRGCIFDNGFLDITPNPIPTPTNPVRGVTLFDIKRPSPNNNNRLFSDGGELGKTGRTANSEGVEKDFEPINKETESNKQKGDFEPINKESGKEIENPKNESNDGFQKTENSKIDVGRGKTDNNSNNNSSSPVIKEKPVIINKPSNSSPVNKPSTTPSVTPSKPSVNGGLKPGKG